MSTFTRRLAVYRHLARSDGATLRDLARRFGTTKNAIQRDIDALSLAGVAVTETCVGQTLRYALAEPWRFDSGISASERAALDAARAALEPLGRVNVFRDLESLRGRLTRSRTEEAWSSVGPRGLRAPAESVMTTLLAGILEHRRCRVEHRRRRASRARTHEVEPLRFVVSGGLVYLDAIATTHRGRVTFAAHLIRRATLLETKFVPPRRQDELRFGVWDGEPREVEARFDAEIAPYIVERRWHPSQRLETHADGSVTLRARMSGMFEVVGWLMSWGDCAELLRPLEWRGELLRRARGLVRRHAS